MGYFRIYVKSQEAIIHQPSEKNLFSGQISTRLKPQLDPRDGHELGTQFSLQRCITSRGRLYSVKDPIIVALYPYVCCVKSYFQGYAQKVRILVTHNLHKC